MKWINAWWTDGRQCTAIHPLPTQKWSRFAHHRRSSMNGTSDQRSSSGHPTDSRTCCNRTSDEHMHVCGRGPNDQHYDDSWNTTVERQLQITGFRNQVDVSLSNIKLDPQQIITRWQQRRKVEAEQKVVARTLHHWQTRTQRLTSVHRTPCPRGTPEHDRGETASRPTIISA